MGMMSRDGSGWGSGVRAVLFGDASIFFDVRGKERSFAQCALNCHNRPWLFELRPRYGS